MERLFCKLNFAKVVALWSLFPLVLAHLGCGVASKRPFHLLECFLFTNPPKRLPYALFKQQGSRFSLDVHYTFVVSESFFFTRKGNCKHQQVIMSNLVIFFCIACSCCHTHLNGNQVGYQHCLLS